MPPFCPWCSHQLATSEVQDGWCDSCGKRLPAGGGAQSPGGAVRATETASGAAPAVTVGRSDAASWGAVRGGLSQVIVGVIALLVFGALFAVLVLSARDGRAPGGPALAAIGLLQLTPFGLVAATALVYAGMCLGCAAPANSVGTGAALGVPIFLVAFFVLFGLSLTAAVVSAREPGLAGAARVLLLLASLAGQLTVMFYALFLRGVGRSLGNPRLASASLLFALVYAAVAVLGVAGHFALSVVHLGHDQERAFSIALGGAAVVLMLWFLLLAFSARGTISRAVS